MCSRYTLTAKPDAVQKLFSPMGGAIPPFPGPHLYPGSDLPVARFNLTRGERSLGLLRWGLVPHWADDPSIGRTLINARAETLAEKPSFRDAFMARRCLVPADGFIEWQKEGERKQPFRFARSDGAPFAIAGLWDGWRDQEGNWLRSFTIVTTVANDLVSPIHDRMPVIVEPRDFPVWLGEIPVDEGRLNALLRPCSADGMRVDPLIQKVA